MGRLRRAAAITFVTFVVALHLGGLAYRLLPSRATSRLPRPVQKVAARLERTARWDMFRTLGTVDRLVVEGSDATGAWYDLANPYHRGLDPWLRFVDRRLRAFHDRLNDKRRLSIWGVPYLRHLCRVGALEHPRLHQARVVRIPSRDPSRKLVMLRLRCATDGAAR